MAGVGEGIEDIGAELCIMPVPDIEGAEAAPEGLGIMLGVGCAGAIAGGAAVMVGIGESVADGAGAMPGAGTWATCCGAMLGPAGAGAAAGGTMPPPSLSCCMYWRIFSCCSGEKLDTICRILADGPGFKCASSVCFSFPSFMRIV